MPKLSCFCGESISLSVDPNPQEFSLVWEPILDQLLSELKTAHQQAMSDGEFVKEISKLFYLREPRLPTVIECPNCGRLLVFANASDSKPTLWFQREGTNGQSNSLRSLLKEIDSESD